MRAALLSIVCCLFLAGCTAGDGAAPDAEGDGSRRDPAAQADDDSAGQRAGPARPPRPDDWFEDVTRQSGVHFEYRNGREGGRYTILETVGGGAALLDWDADGDLDLFVPGGGTISGAPGRVAGRSSVLYRNDGGWTFTDVTGDAGLGGITDYSHGCAVGDFNGDGLPDLFVTCYGRSRLYRNQGDGRFSDVTQDSGLLADGWSTAAVWADVDRDGLPDLYVARYLDWELDRDEFCGDRTRGVRDVCAPQNYPPARDRLFHNRGEGTFAEISESAGLTGLERGMGVVAADVNADGWIDFYVANDVGPNHLYLGGPELRFRETGQLSGTALNEYGAPEGSMGVDFGDFDGDGRGDLWVTNFEMEDNSLYRNEGDGLFRHATVAAGLGGRGRPLVGFGTGLVDFDTDGRLDLFAINGHVYYRLGRSPYRQPAALYRNLGGRFEDATDRGGPWFSVPHAGRGAAVGDLDNDGAPDLVVVGQNEPLALLRNRRTPRNWIRLELKGTRSDPGAVGAVVSTSHEGRTLVRFVRGGAGYLSHFDSRILLPIDDETGSLEATVRWPDGTVEVFRNLTAGVTNRLIEGSGMR